VWCSVFGVFGVRGVRVARGVRLRYLSGHFGLVPSEYRAGLRGKGRPFSYYGFFGYICMFVCTFYIGTYVCRYSRSEPNPEKSRLRPPPAIRLAGPISVAFSCFVNRFSS
jgi:hypothetical protein